MAPLNEPEQEPKPKEDSPLPEVELSAEEQAKKDDIDLMVERLADPKEEVQLAALEALRSEVKSLNTSLSSIPLGLKFLRRHYAGLKQLHAAASSPSLRVPLADVLSVLAMTVADEDSRESLRFRLLGSKESIDAWGHEYVRNLSAELALEFAARAEADPDADQQDLLELVAKIVPFNMKHNSEPDACDLLLEVERLGDIVAVADEQNVERVCLYLLATARYLPEPEDADVLRVVLQLYRKHERHCDALVAALLLGEWPKVLEVYASAPDASTRKQLALLLARHQGPQVEEEDQEVQDLLGNSHLHAHYRSLARDLDVLEPKAPRDIYKTHLIDNRHASSLAQTMVSAKQNLAATFVNAFVNVGFGTDTLLKLSDEDQDTSETSWIYKNKGHGQMSVAASAGLVYLWDVDEGVAQLDAFLEQEDEHIKAGALLGVGLAHSSVRQPDVDLALLYLQEHLGGEEPEKERIGAVMGLGVAYAGSAREDLLEVLNPMLLEEASGVELLGNVAYALGLIFVGTCHEEVANTITEVLLLRGEEVGASPYGRYLSLGLGLLYLSQQAKAEGALLALSMLSEPVASYAQVTLETCAYAGSGNMLKLQKLLHQCAEHLGDEADSTHQAVAVLGIGLIAMAEDVGSEMAVRMLNHLLQYGDAAIKRSVPLALGLLSISNPRIEVVDTLSKLSHEADPEVAQSATLALGMVGAGTNNSRIAGLLRQLSAFYCKDPNQLFTVRIAQGLLHLGKGLITLDPYTCHGMLLAKVPLAGLLGVMHASLDFENIVHGSGHYFLTLFACAMRPRMLMTFGEDLQPLEVPVRVGAAVDTVGQAGKPKTITGFQTHSTPVLIAHKERAELATDEYLPMSTFMEGCVILRPNPDFEPQE